MDYITLLAAAVAAAKRVERVVEIRPVENGLVYVNQKGEERFVEVARPIVQPKEVYDDGPLKQEVATAIVESISPINQTLDQHNVTLEALEEALSDVSAKMGEDIVDRTNTLLGALRDLRINLDTKSEKGHTHEQYLTQEQVLGLIRSDDLIFNEFEKLANEIGSLNNGIEAIVSSSASDLVSVNKALLEKSDLNHKHPEYVVWSELERRLLEDGYDDESIRKRIASVQDDLVKLSRQQRDSLDSVVNNLLAEMNRQLESKSSTTHTHEEFNAIGEEISQIRAGKADRKHVHTEYLTRDDVLKIIPDIPAGLESAKIERNHLILYLTDGTSIDAGRVVKSATFVGGGGGGGSQGKDGKSAYQIWLDLGNEGTEQDFIDAISTGGSVSRWVYIGEPTTYTNNPSIVFEPITIDGQEVYQMGVYEP